MLSPIMPVISRHLIKHCINHCCIY